MNLERSHRDNNFNLLRFIFASLVIVSHVPELQDGNRSNEILTKIFGSISFGELAVDSFFLISGFLILKSWIERPDFLNFVVSRVLRIYPGFIFACLISAFLVAPFYSVDHYFREIDYFVFARGLFKLSLEGIPPVFMGTPHAHLNGVVWSIPYEFKCYFLVAVFGVVFGLKFKLPWVFLFFILFFAFVSGSVFSIETPFYTYFRCGMAFAAGGFFYLFRHEMILNKQAALMSLMSFLVLLFFAPLAEVALVTLFAYSIFYFALNAKSFLWFNKFPDVSYGIYLYAWPINKVLLWHNPSINCYYAIILVFIFSLIAGILSWYLIERPFINLKCFFMRKNSI